MIFVPDARTCMIWKEGSKWEHVASATRHGQVQHGGVIHRFNFWLLFSSILLMIILIFILQFGDWFLLRQMSKNVDAAVFAEFLKQLDKEENIWSEKGTLGR